MAAGSTGALKAWVEAGGLGLACFGDEAPDGQPLPYVTIHEDIALTPSMADAPFDASVPSSFNELAQVDLWQQWRVPATGQVSVNYGLGRALARRLHGVSLMLSGGGAPPTKVYGCLLVNMQRFFEVDTNLVHHALTVRISEDL